jgi:ELWxxDGT repeat protein
MVLGNQLWRSDGTPEGTLPLVPETPAWDPIRNIELLGSIGSEVYFAATTYRHGRELWVSDGTPAGTQLALDLGPSETSGLPLWIGRHDDRLFGLFAADPQSGSPSIRSVVPPNARPVFLGLEIDTWPDEPTQISAERLRSLIEAPPDTPIDLVPANPLSTAGGSWTLIDGLFTYSPPPGHLGSDQLPLEIRYPGGPPLTTLIQVTVQPTPPPLALEPTLTRRSSGPIEVRAFTRRGHRHAFERSLDLTLWTPLEIRVAPTSEPSLWIDSAPPSPAAHYRLRVVP